MTEVEVQGLKLPLTLHPGPGDGERAVLMLHGASTRSSIFSRPRGGLIRHLQRHADVWTLDWRGGAEVVGKYQNQHRGQALTLDECKLFSLDNVAEFDIPGALRKIAAERPSRNVSLLGFCVGAGAVARAVERGHVEGLNVRGAVLMTLGLFYETPWDGWLKAADFLLERSLVEGQTERTVDPTLPERWPEALSAAFDFWPKSWLGPGRELPILERTSFMFGNTLGPEGRDEEVTPEFLRAQYGGMHIGLYVHLSQMVRRGAVAPYDEPELPPLSELDARYFQGKHVTLITGAQNRLWHRDCIDRMYDWLRRARLTPAPRKIVLSGFGHLDLLWSSSAPEVYAHVEKAILA